MAKPQIFNRDMKRLAYLDNALAVGYGLETTAIRLAGRSLHGCGVRVFRAFMAHRYAF